MHPAGALRSMTASALAATLVMLCAPSFAQEARGISSLAISRCAGKLGSQVRAGDQAFPLFSLDGIPWVKIERGDRTVDGLRIATTVTGTGAHHRRRGQVVGFRFTCLLDDKGEALAFSLTDLLPERGEGLPPALIVRGAASYLPRLQLPQGVELRAQLLDVSRDAAGEVLSETVVRSSWEEPIPFVLRLPPDTGLDGRKAVIAARLVIGSADLYELKQAHPVSAADIGRPIELRLDPVTGKSP